MLLVSMRELACVMGERRLGDESVLVTGEQSFLDCLLQCGSWAELCVALFKGGK